MQGKVYLELKVSAEGEQSLLSDLTRLVLPQLL